MAAAAPSGTGLSDAEFDRFTEYFYKRTGIHFTPGKRYFVDKRVETCIRSSPFDTFASWFAALRMDRPDMLQELINQLTVNETYFLREDYQFDAMLSTVLPKTLAARGGPGRMSGPVKILSLPCSTGEEPYSIALRLLEEWDQIDHVDVEIHGADIDSEVLAKAAHASYGERSLQRVPKAWVNKYFTSVGSGRFQVDEGIRSAVTLHRMNVCDTAAMKAFRDFDVIFCRNVLIYFDELSSRRAAENLYGALRPGGYLFLGHSESMSRISPIFTPTRLPEGIVYQRPTGAK
ncbi:chemotaxis protein [Actinoplanes sp. SE50]|uniref:CheR family methyltransferase n=1 Tax=unclassified Actinoplanes TaxID=2626549 RepID=UPI00023EC389|nr:MULTISPECIES: protein-glutamate O-methyltransferase CheR [unclassified Actinoplanes]AEV88011.1 chemotaxis protein methyltransferase CheR [Actinoplanes sp. SE50/110]ATO86415.1 chemotaxis protein [Actinoplanes sp. SE50]SLM03830.1 chemotaxis protein [Actinoplanes sp. SE50/110]